QERPAELILVGWIEAEIVVPVGVVGAGNTDVDGVAIIFGRRFLPGRSPARGTGRNRTIADRATVAVAASHPSTAEKAEPAVIEIVAVGVIERHHRAGRAH